MSVNDPSQISAKATQGRLDAILHTAALIVAVVGALGSLVFMLRAGQRTPLFLLVLFIIWVLSPFAGLLWANIVSKRWSFLTRVTLYCVTLVVALCSLTVYSELIVVRPPGSANAFLWVVVPPVMWVLITVVVGVAAFVSRRLLRRDVA
jgi:hypothetical protein